MALATLLKTGMSGGTVSELQSRLAAKGFDPGGVDGVFGPLTEAAVRQFQGANGLVVDGIVGPATWAALGETADVTLVSLGLTAEQTYGLRVGECDAPGAPSRWSPVQDVHSPGSYHYKHRAFDASGSDADMARFTAWLDANHAAEITELIHKFGGSIKDGVRVDPSFWGDAWDAHEDHVHLAI